MSNVFERFAQQADYENFSDLISSPQQQEPLEIDIENDVVAKYANVFEEYADKNKQKESEKFGWLDTLKDIGEQALTKGIAGVGGAYGNILDTLGLQVKSDQEILPGQRAIYNAQSDILNRINRGETPSFSELMLLSDDDIASGFGARLPSSKDIESGIESLTGIGQGKTPAGRIAGQGAQFVGEGIATGGGLKTLAGMGAGGLGGQSIREVGGPELAASAIEIGGSLAPSAISGKLAPLGKATKDTVKGARSIGLTDDLITPLVQGEKKIATLSKVARKGTRTKEVFAKIKKSLGDSYDTIKGNKLAKTKIPRDQQTALTKEFSNIRNDLYKTLAPSPDKQAAIDYIEKSLSSLRDVNVTPEYLVNFWQDINKSVNWNSIQGGKKSLAKLKEPISDILKKVSPELAKDFEITNDLYSKYSQISKKLKPDVIDSLLSKGEILAAIPAGISLATGNPWALSSIASTFAIRTLAREMLINPYFQNISSKLVKNFNSGSIKAIEQSVKQAQEYMQRKHPNEKWDFLTKSLNQK